MRGSGRSGRLPIWAAVSDRPWVSTTPMTTSTPSAARCRPALSISQVLPTPGAAPRKIRKLALPSVARAAASASGSGRVSSSIYAGGDTRFPAASEEVAGARLRQGRGPRQTRWRQPGRQEGFLSPRGQPTSSGEAGRPRSALPQPTAHEFDLWPHDTDRGAGERVADHLSLRPLSAPA